MDKDFKNIIVNESKSLDELALKICGYGYFDHPNNDREYPVKREYIREYLEIGMMYGMRKTGTFKDNEMTIQELIESSESPLSEEQREELRKQHITEVGGRDEDIRRLQREISELSRRIDEMKARGDNIIADAVACIDTVKAMLRHSSHGATHRMRNFYAEAIEVYVNNVRDALKRMTFDGEIPF